MHLRTYTHKKLQGTVFVQHKFLSNQFPDTISNNLRNQEAEFLYPCAFSPESSFTRLRWCWCEHSRITPGVRKLKAEKPFEMIKQNSLRTTHDSGGKRTVVRQRPRIFLSQLFRGIRGTSQLMALAPCMAYNIHTQTRTGSSSLFTGEAKQLHHIKLLSGTFGWGKGKTGGVRPSKGGQLSLKPKQKFVHSATLLEIKLAPSESNSISYPIR